MAILVKNIKKLVQVESEPVMLRAGADMQTVNTIDNAYLLTVGDKIAAFGEMKDFSEKILSGIKEKIETIDATGKMVYPAFCDSHTHIVYADFRNRVLTS